MFVPVAPHSCKSLGDGEEGLVLSPRLLILPNTKMYTASMRGKENLGGKADTSTISFLSPHAEKKTFWLNLDKSFVASFDRLVFATFFDTLNIVGVSLVSAWRGLCKLSRTCAS